VVRGPFYINAYPLYYPGIPYKKKNKNKNKNKNKRTKKNKNKRMMKKKRVKSNFMTLFLHRTFQEII
jgi:hypothetical protein